MFYLAAQAGHQCPQRLRIVAVTDAPKFFDDITGRQNFTGILEKKGQQCEFHRGQVDLLLIQIDQMFQVINL
ncbi:hypothetical protein SDC9_163041 [bioreactor metagenome]|uniref:Uncharacterized protein n=1 Tax=bioreactor metagenome TaxID=1076179 RepID=A0A645FMS1_9ZZZZ